MSTQTPTRDGTVLLTPADAGRLANVSRDTIYREVQRGALPAKHVGRQLRIEPADFARYLEERQVDAMSPGSQRQESPASRLIGAGYYACGLGWLTPSGLSILTLEEALAELPDPQPAEQDPGFQESAHSRAIAAGYVLSPGGWLAAEGQRVVSLEEALAEIEGEGPA